MANTIAKYINTLLDYTTTVCATRNALVGKVYVAEVFGTIRAFEQGTLPTRDPRQATRRFSRFRRASVARLIRARRSRIIRCRPAYMSAGVTFCSDSCSRRWL